MEKISNLSLACVRYSDGTINVASTLEAFKTQVIALVDVEELLGTRIEQAVRVVFDTYRGQALPVPALVNAALHLLDVTPATFATYSSAVAEYVRNRPETYKIAKGKGGGVSRLSDAK